MELMLKLIFLILVFNATAYAPDSAYSESGKKFISQRLINGDKFDSWGLPISEFTIACSLQYHGYIFLFTSEIPESQVRYCTDSVELGLKPKRIDIAITQGNNDQRNNKAFAFGRQVVSAKLISGSDFLKCRGLNVPERKTDIHIVVISQLYINLEDCLW